MYKKLNFPSTSVYVAYLLKLQGGPSQNCPVEQINPKNIFNLRVSVLIFFSHFLGGFCRLSVYLL